MGILYIVATPIGNLKDITLRSIEILKSVDYILCEDTRITGKLLNHYQIAKKMASFNDFNESSKTGEVIVDLLQGKNIALVSDAGTPLVSDPGFKLVREATIKDIKVESIPGPSAVISALTVSGLPPDKFIFLGYLPKKEGKRKHLLQNLFTILQSMEDKQLRPTVIFFESPYRLIKSLTNIKNVFGDIEVVICRELTKIHEEVRREKILAVIEHFTKVAPKGEFTLLF